MSHEARSGCLGGPQVQLLAPDVFPIEIAHAITRAERQGRVTQAQGAAFLVDILNALPQLSDSLLLLPRAYEISSPMRIGVYDCLYVALAERERCDLITADDRLVRVLQSQFPFLVSLASLP
jgi:predicted nucleic acid-binding protein